VCVKGEMNGGLRRRREKIEGKGREGWRGRDGEGRMDLRVRWRRKDGDGGTEWDGGGWCERR